MFEAKNINYIQFLLILSLSISVILSLYILIAVLFFKDKQHRNIFSAWQFPMLLAILIDSVLFYFDGHT